MHIQALQLALAKRVNISCPFGDRTFLIYVLAQAAVLYAQRGDCGRTMSVANVAKRQRGQSKLSDVEDAKRVLEEAGPDADRLLLRLIAPIGPLKAQEYLDVITGSNAYADGAGKDAVAYFRHVLGNPWFASNPDKLEESVFKAHPNAWAQMAAFYARTKAYAPICQVLSLDKSALSLLEDGDVNMHAAVIPRIAIALDTSSTGGEYAGKLTKENTRKLKAWWDELHLNPLAIVPELTTNPDPVAIRIIETAAKDLTPEATPITLARIVEQTEGGGMYPIIMGLGLGRDAEHIQFILDSKQDLRDEFGGNVAKIAAEQHGWDTHGGIVGRGGLVDRAPADDALHGIRDAVSEYFPAKVGTCGDVVYNRKAWAPATGTKAIPPWVKEWIRLNRIPRAPTYDWTALTTITGVRELARTMNEWGCEPSFAIVGDGGAMLSTEAFPPPGGEEKLARLKFWTNVPVTMTPGQSQRGLVRVPGATPDAPGHMFNCRVVPPGSASVDDIERLAKRIIANAPKEFGGSPLHRLLDKWINSTAGARQEASAAAARRYCWAGEELVRFLDETHETFGAHGWELETILQARGALTGEAGTTVVYIDSRGLLDRFMGSAAGTETKAHVAKVLETHGFAGPITHVLQAATFPVIDQSSDESPCTAIAMYRHIVYTHEDSGKAAWVDARRLAQGTATLFIALLHKGAFVILPGSNKSLVADALQENPEIAKTILCNMLGPKREKKSALTALARQMSAASAGAWPLMTTPEVADMIAVAEENLGELDNKIKPLVIKRISTDHNANGKTIYDCAKRLEFTRVGSVKENGMSRRFYESGDLSMERLVRGKEIIELGVAGHVVWHLEHPGRHHSAMVDALVSMSHAHVIDAAHSLTIEELLDELQTPGFFIAEGADVEVECVFQAAFTDNAA